MKRQLYHVCTLCISLIFLAIGTEFAVICNGLALFLQGCACIHLENKREPGKED